MFLFEKLNAYQQARLLVIPVYKLIEQFPDKEKFGLASQLRRAVTSVPSNIAEGVSRNSAKDQAHFIEIAYGSLMETFCQLKIAADLGYIKAEELKNIKENTEKVARLLSGLRASMLQKTDQTN